MVQLFIFHHRVTRGENEEHNRVFGQPHQCRKGNGLKEIEKKKFASQLARPGSKRWQEEALTPSRG